MKFKFNSVDNLSLLKILKLHILIVIVRSVFKEENNYYPQDSRYECLHELKMLEYDSTDIQKKLILIKQIHQKTTIFAIIGIFKIEVLGMNHIFAIVFMV